MNQRPSRARVLLGRRFAAPPAQDRFARLREIQRLDSRSDCVRIYHLMHEDFQSAHRLSGYQTLLFTFAAKEISRVIASTGEFRDHIFKRMVDTFLLDQAYHVHGFEPGAGRDAIRRVNQMHAKFGIADREFVAVSCAEAYGHVYFAETYGWRPVTDKEKEAAVEFAKLRARYMGFSGVPDTFEEMKEFLFDYLDRELSVEPWNAEMAHSLTQFLLQGQTSRLRRKLRRNLLFSAGFDLRILEACGYEAPSPIVRKICRWFIRQWYGRLDPLVDGPTGAQKAMVEAHYPDGYEISKLGTNLPVRDAPTPQGR